MIIAERKPMEKILSMITRHKKILVVGCKGCVTVCSAGGENEVRILSSALRMARAKEENEIELEETTIERQCDPEYIEPLRKFVGEVDAILSMACGAGVQFVAEKLKDIPVYPALNTTFIGVTEEQGVWTERCHACGDCKLDRTGGICPIARCSKSLLNGPCGGSVNGKCEINPEIDCGWQLIWDRLKLLGMEDRFEEIIPINDWSTSRDGGPRKVEREDLKL
jgi:ferredoxin